MMVKVTNNRKIAEQLRLLRQEIADYSREAYARKDPTSSRAQNALRFAQQAIDKIKELVAGDPVFGKDVSIMSLPGYYEDLVRHAQASQTVAEEALEYLDRDQAVFEQDFAEPTEYRRRLKELADMRPS